MEWNIFDKEVAFGLLPFETIYFADEEIHFINDHYLRFKRACRVFKIKFEYSLDKFCSEIHLFIEKSGEKCGVIKLIVLNNKLNLNIREPNYSVETYRRGLNLTLSKSLKDRKNIFNYFKTFNYGVNYIENLRAKEKSYDGALFLNNEKFICETSSANIFFVNNNTIYTPDLRNGILDGVLRKNVIKEATKLGYEIKKANVKMDELVGYEECFITNSVAGVFPVAKINHYSFYSKEFSNKINNNKYFKRSWNR